MSARSEGDETPLWLEGAGASTHSHSEWIVGRSRALMNNPG